MSPKDPNAVALGQKGGNARKVKRSADELSAYGKAGASARWKGHTPKPRQKKPRNDLPPAGGDKG